ncbi:MAG: DinB family protein [Terriglobales bacterium]|jgi:uncharacterized damage-inducible protein DinB
MKKTILATWILLLGLCSMALAAPAAPQDNADHTAPSYDMKPQSLLDLEQVQKKMAALAEALPADKFAWRPSTDSRSFAEVFLHVSGERYDILGMMGATAPTGFNGKTYEQSTTDKARIIEELNKSWEFSKNAINSMTNADFAKPLPKLGPQANAGDVIYILVADAHEHLGQIIAYARVNGIVPPWTAAAKKKAAEKK